MIRAVLAARSTSANSEPVPLARPQFHDLPGAEPGTTITTAASKYTDVPLCIAESGREQIRHQSGDDTERYAAPTPWRSATNMFKLRLTTDLAPRTRTASRPLQDDGGAQDELDPLRRLARQTSLSKKPRPTSGPMVRISKRSSALRRSTGDA